MNGFDQLSAEVAQEEIHGQLYGRADLVRFYASAVLHPPEAIALVRYRDDILDRRVLDLGCGAGRLATFLGRLTNQYLGLDRSPHMVEFCRRRMPDLRFLQADMRDLTAFPDACFDGVFAVFNLFDAVAHNDRLRILAEVRRVLVPGGLLLFSAHNRNFAHLGESPKVPWSRNPVTLLRSVVDFFQARANCRRIKPHQRFENEYALVIDAAHNFAVLHYYITRHSQMRQLAEAGFEPIECLDEAGRTLHPDDDDRACSSIHYVARPG